MNARIVVALAFALVVVIGTARAADPTVDEIVEKANRVAYYQGRDGRASVKMTIKDDQGRTDTREFIILRRDELNPDAPDDDTYCADQKFYVYFRLPADLNKMVFMVWKHVDKDDDRWLYTPALDNVKRIAASDKRTSFVGSHFFYEDVSGRNIDDDEHELMEITDNYYVLKNTPKDPKAVEFAWYKVYIHKTTFLITKAEYYDPKGDAYRTYDAQKVETIQGFPTVVKARMRDSRIGGETEIEYSAVTYNIGFPEDIFTERYLRRAPREYLR